MKLLQKRGKFNQRNGVKRKNHMFDAIIWINKNQFGRRNLSAYDRSILALKLKPVIAAKLKKNKANAQTFWRTLQKVPR